MTWGTEAVSVSFGDTVALNSVTVAVEHERVLAVVGGDGAGKTTLAKVMVGLVEVNLGRVRRPLPKQIGYQSEASGVWEDLTVSENLGFVASAHRLALLDKTRRIDQLLEITRLGPARDRLARDLSGGMRQKLGVAMALLPNPLLLVLDEPTTGLDPVSRTDLWTLIARSAADGAAVLVTTAYLNEAARADRVLVLDEGEVIAQGTLEQVRQTTPGLVATVTKPDNHLAWRRGRTWRAWFPNGKLPQGAIQLQPDLADLITVAALARTLDR